MQKEQTKTSITTVGLAIFAMLFGAGNIIFPIKAGVTAGSNNFFGMMGFLLTGAFLPLLGLVTIILFDGDYKKFFNRLGTIPGFFAILFCMLLIGLIGIPRCITVPYSMISPFLPSFLTLPMFSALFTLITFALTYKDSKLLEVLGKFIGPVKVISLSYIAAQGLWSAQYLTENISISTESPWCIFTEQFIKGFQTLDLIGGIFFGYVIVKLLHANPVTKTMSQKQLALLSLKGGAIGSGLLTLIYISYSYLGAFYGHLVTPSMNGAEIFRVVALNIVGQYGAFIIIITALMACLSTASALAIVFSEYLKTEVFHKKISYIPCLIITLSTATIISNFGLTNILNFSEPYINMGYPIIVVAALCNIAYKLFGFSWIKLPVGLTALFIIGMQVYPYLV